jgi:hypothetical protein
LVLVLWLVKCEIKKLILYSVHVQTVINSFSISRKYVWLIVAAGPTQNPALDLQNFLKAARDNF